MGEGLNSVGGLVFLWFQFGFPMEWKWKGKGPITQKGNGASTFFLFFSFLFHLLPRKEPERRLTKSITGRQSLDNEVWSGERGRMRETGSI